MRAEKQLLLDEIKEKITGSTGFVALQYKDLTASRAREFRDKMAELGGDFEVVRKRIFIKAAESVGIKFELDGLQGHVGVVFAEEDVTPIAKGALKFGEDNDKAVSLLGGRIEGEVCSAEDVEAIAKLPSLQELRAQFVGLIEAPMAQTAQVLHAVLAGVMYCLEEKSKKE